MKINISLDSNWQINISFQCFILEQMGVPKQRLRKSFKTKKHGIKTLIQPFKNRENFSSEGQ